MTNMTHKFLSMYLFLTLYLFPTHRAHHQERQIVSIQSLVTVTLCWWPCRVHTTRPPTQSDSYQRLYWHNLSLLMMSTMCSKHIGHLPRIISDGSCRESQKTYLCSVKFSRQSFSLWNSVEIYCVARQPTDRNTLRRMPFTCRGAEGTNTHTQNM